MRESINTHKPYLCVDCGAPVTRRVKRCPSCAHTALKQRPTYERTPEHNKRLSERLKGQPKPFLKGRKRPIVARKISAAWTDEMKEAARKRGKENAQDKEWLLRIAKALTGENNPRWQGGISGKRYAPGFSKSLKDYIRERDGHTCQLCAMTEDEIGYRLSIHHADYDKSNHDESNLFATCKRCNSLVNTNRDVWIGYFFALAKRRQLGQDVDNLITRKVITQREGFISTQYIYGGEVGPDLADLFSSYEPLP